MDDKHQNPDLKILIEKLKDTAAVNSAIHEEQVSRLTTHSEIEEFVIKNSTDLVTQCIATMREVKDYIIASNDPDSISALADLVNASSNAIESLNKIVIQNKKSATTIVVKKMDIDSRKGIEDRLDQAELVGTREEIFRKLIEKSKVIDVVECDLCAAEVASPGQQNPSSLPSELS